MSEVTVKGNPISHIENVSVDIKQALVQRVMRPNSAESYLKQVGEFDWNLFGAVLVAEYPNKERELVDGGHRVYMAKKSIPNIKTVPALIAQVNNEEEASQLFHRYNGTVRKNVNPEEIFISKYHGNEKDAQFIATGLQHCNLRVTNGKISVVNDTNKTIKVTKFAQMYKRDQATAILTARYIDEAFPNEKSVNVILFMGIFELIRTFSKFNESWGKWEASFIEFLNSLGTMEPQSKLTFPEMRKDNHYGISVAWGLYEKWYTYLKQQNKVKPFALKKMRELYLTAGLRK